MTIQIIKRNGDKEDLNIDKIHQVLTKCTEGYSGVSVSDIEMNSKLSFYDGIKTTEIHDVLIRSAADLISEDNPNYQYVAAKLLLLSLRKEVWGSDEPPRLWDFIQKNKELYDSVLFEKYTESEIHKIGKLIKHSRDNLFTYSGLQQLTDKYLLKNRSTKQIYETPQFAFILIPMVIFSSYPNGQRTEYIRRFYDAVSQFKINLPTPIMCGVRSLNKQYSSCVLIDSDDSLDSIFSSNSAVALYSAKRAGIGLNVGRIRPINSPIRGGEVIHTGLIPYLKVFESTVKSTSQNGIRGSCATVNIPFFHYEVEDVIVLKNNSGTDDNRVRKLDYVVQFSKLFYDRLIKDETITLFSPFECKELYDKFGHPEFDEEYLKCEKNKKLQFKKVIKARDLASLFSKERLETGRIYLMNLDHVNQNGSWIDDVKMGNLCNEINHPTIPIKSLDDKDGEIGICILSAINLLEVKEEEYESVCDIVVRFLDELIDYQDYPVKAGENFAKNRRSLAIGFTNLAAFLANHKLKYGDQEAINLVHKYSELLQYWLLRASCNVAKEKGKCNKFGRTKYSEGKMPIDRYQKTVDSICTEPLHQDWNSLRKDILEFGLRHSTLTAQMPCESSSVIQNSTNGIEPVRSIISYKKSKSGVLKQLVPQVKYKNYYETAFTLSNKDITNISAVIQKFFDMSMSTNHYYDYKRYENGMIPLSELVKDMLYLYKMGCKTLYYTNTTDADNDISCVSGACSI